MNEPTGYRINWEKVWEAMEHRSWVTGLTKVDREYIEILVNGNILEDCDICCRRRKTSVKSRKRNFISNAREAYVAFNSGLKGLNEPISFKEFLNLSNMEDCIKGKATHMRFMMPLKQGVLKK